MIVPDAATSAGIRAAPFLEGMKFSRGPIRLDPVASMNFLTILAVWNFAILLMVNEHLTHRLRDQARRDGLTGALNRTGFREAAERMHGHCIRERRPASLMLLDLDHFKAVNDRYGHQAGDQMLRAFADAVRPFISARDVFARYGGEEFCLVVPECSAREVAAIAERIRKACEAIRVPSIKGEVATTVSIGIAGVELPAESIEAAATRADEALYAAKRGGRNQVVVAPTP